MKEAGLNMSIILRTVQSMDAVSGGLLCLLQKILKVYFRTVFIVAYFIGQGSTMTLIAREGQISRKSLGKMNLQTKFVGHSRKTTTVRKQWKTPQIRIETLAV
jgi:hypothetical protein